MKKKIIYLMVVMMMGVTLVAGCGGTASPSPSASVAPESSAPAEQSEAPAETTGQATAPADGAIQFQDMSGRDITMDKPAKSIVAVTPADCEILYALGAGDTLVGRGEYCDWPEAVKDVESVQSGQDLNVESIVALQPEVVLMSTMDHSMDVVKQMEDAGLKVVTSQSTNIEGVYNAITMIGKVVGKDAEAEQLVADMKSQFDEIKASALSESKTVYFEVSPLEYGLWASGANTFMDEISNMLGLENAFADVDGWVEVSEEQVIERNPDYIVTITMYFGDGPQPDVEIAGRKGWEGITAVKENQIFLANADELSRPGPRLVDGAKDLLEFISK